MKILLILTILASLSYAQTEFVIAANDSLSNVVDLYKSRVIAIQAPDSWTDANISFRASDKINGTFVPVLKDSVTYLSIKIVPSGGIYLIPPSYLAGFRYLQLQSGYGGPMYIKQTAKRVIKAYTWTSY